MEGMWLFFVLSWLFYVKNSYDKKTGKEVYTHSKLRHITDIGLLPP